MKNLAIDTIVALATPAGRGGIAVVRVSGPIVTKIAHQLLNRLPKPRTATLSVFVDQQQNPLDEGIALYFPAPNSFTGEDVLELQGHGGPAVIDLLIQAILQSGARMARPGEFTERAFLNDKIDLAQAEAIADLIDAVSAQAARSALRSLQGEFSARINQLVEMLIRLRMYVEAAIDFVEEEINFLADTQISTQLASITDSLKEVLNSATQGSLLREGITIVIAGEPNVGKSSLLNYLSGKDTAIVTDIPGTTRDLLREQINIDGMPIHIIDTAGLRDSDDPIEQEGMRRAQREIVQADLVLLLQDASKPHAVPAAIPTTARQRVITVKNKIDLTNDAPAIHTDHGKTSITLSAKTGAGMELLTGHIKASVGLTENNEGIFSARRRHLDALARAQEFLQCGYHQLTANRAGELLAEDLRQAQFALAEITGEFRADDLLGRIFSSFCIGK
ncbi:MAG: tRNA uridine-5-carboxymethylaminomethyl(34) synthesis GTPase MnmE [Pseudomonadota bacterium]